MNQTQIASNLIRSASHICAVTKCNDPFGSLERISDRQFEKIAGVNKITFKRIIESSGKDWIKAFKENYLRSKKEEDRRISLMYGLGGKEEIKK